MYRVFGLPGVVVTVSTTITPLNSARDEAEVSTGLSGVIMFVGWKSSEKRDVEVE